MENIILNPDITPVQIEYLDDVKIVSTENKQLFGYANDNANIYSECGVITVQEPGYYTKDGNDNYIKLNVVPGEECTDEFFNLPAYSGRTRTPQDVVYRCNVTIDTYTYTYLYTSYYESSYYRENYYSLNDSSGNSIIPFVAKEGEELWTATYNLENGYTVEIVGICNGRMIDDNDNQWHLNVRNDYTYFTVMGHESLYYCDGWYPGWTQEYGEGTHWCEKLPNWKYRFKNGFPLELSDVGSALTFTYYVPQGSTSVSVKNYYSVDDSFPITEPITVLTSAGTETAFTQGVKIIYEDNGNKVYSFTTSIEYSSCYFFTGSTWNNLSWVGDRRGVSYLRINAYEMLKFPKVSDSNVMVAEMPSVAYVENSDKVYYTSHGIPILDEGTNEFVFMLRGNPVVFDRNLNIEISNNRDFECGGYYLNPEDIVKLEAKDSGGGDWVDITTQFLDGTYINVNLWRFMYVETPGNYWHYASAFRVTFTDEALQTLVFNAHQEGCSY